MYMYFFIKREKYTQFIYLQGEFAEQIVMRTHLIDRNELMKRSGIREHPSARPIEEETPDDLDLKVMEIEGHLMKETSTEDFDKVVKGKKTKLKLKSSGVGSEYIYSNKMTMSQLLQKLPSLNDTLSFLRKK